MEKKQRAETRRPNELSEIVAADKSGSCTASARRTRIACDRPTSNVEEFPLNTLKTPAGAALVAAVMALALPTGVVRADEAETLRRSITLFDAGDYVKAQELLVAIDRTQLSDSDQALRGDYLNRTQVAITMHEKGMRDLEDAETAIASGGSASAKRLLQGILSNEYVSDRVRAAAETLLGNMRNGNGAHAALASQGSEQDSPKQAPVDDADRARTLTQEADTMLAAGRFAEAERLYRDALSLVVGFPEAVDGLARLRQAQINAAGTRAESLIDQIRREDRINWQRTVAEYRDVEAAIGAEVDSERFERAKQLLVRAGQIIESGKQFADPITKYESLRDEFEKLSASTIKAERDYNERVVTDTRRRVEEDRRQRLEQDAQNRARQVESLMAQALQHRKDGDLDAAINVLRQVSVIDPRDPTARWLTDELVETRDFRQGRALRKAFYKETQRALQDVEEAKIPWHEELRYPKNWPEVIARPERQGPGGSARNRRLISALDQDVSVYFASSSLGEVMDQLADTHQLNVIVNWHDLKRAGVDRATPIDLRLPNEVTLKKALTEVLEQAGGGTIDVGFVLSDGAIKVATQDTLDQDTYQAVYDITDLLMEVPIFNDAPMSDLREVTRRARMAMAAQVEDRPWLYGDDDDDESEEAPERRARVRKIIDLIQDNVVRHSWVDHGGTVGTIDEFNGQLVITHNSAAQRQIASLLGKLREQRAIQIAVESRFITVSSHYLEEMGIDLDIVLNSGTAGYDFISDGGGGVITDPVLGNSLLLPRTFSRLGFTPNTPGLGTPLADMGALRQPFGQTFLVPQRSGGGGSQGSPIPITSNILGFTDPANIGSDISGSFAGNTIGPALSVFGSFLDNIQVDFLIRATQADSRTTVLTAPRLVLFNGQRSWVAVTIQQNFVSTLNPVTGTGSVAQAPITGTIDSGAVLDVNATVTADKRYVTMTLRPGITRLLDLQTIPFSGGAAGGGFGGGTALGAFIQLPTLSSQRVQTTVSIPDGGTLLIGGQKLASETEVEAGVPVLSKIPLLKRAYSSHTMIKDEQTLLILIKPKILIQSEQEELAFPSFSGS